MSFPAEILRSGVKIANGLTFGVQSTVSHSAYIGQDGMGKRSYSTAVNRLCIWDSQRKEIKKLSGESIVIAATLTFIGDVPPYAPSSFRLPDGTPRREPIDPRDKIVLPDGSTGPIIDAPGAVVDPGTGRGFVTVVMIGAL